MQNELESYTNVGEDEFLDFGGGNLLFDYDDLFPEINGEDDVLPDLEMDPEILAEFSVSTGSGDESHNTTSVEKVEENSRNDEVVDKANATSEFGSQEDIISHQDVVRKRDGEKTLGLNPTAKEGEKVTKSSTQSSKNAQGKRKVKVDWTPELHRRFVQAVEQLGVDKAVPSRILELMGIDCLTRHNVASHLQKYRSHRKHMIAREVEAANWTQKRQLYCAPAVTGGKRDMNPWHAPTIGFPPMAPPPMPHFRPLHVWGHPPINQSLMHVWPKHLGPSPTPLHPPPTWPPAAAPPPPTDASFWHHLRAPNTLAPGTPCFPLHLPPARFPAPPVPGIPPNTMYKIEPGIGVPTTPAGQVPQPPLDFHPSNESIDAAIGDVIQKPWLPLPLGLKPPSVDGVLVELQRQGIPKVPPAGLEESQRVQTILQFDDISCS